MVSDYKDNFVNLINQSDDDTKSIINSLCEEKLKLLKEKRFLLNTIAEKDEQLIRVSENFQKKWESVCLYLKSVSELCHDLHLNPNLTTEFKTDNRLIFESPMDSSISNSSFFVTTTDETGDSNFTTSTESLIAVTGTLQNTLEPHEKYFSLNSLPTEQARCLPPCSTTASHSDLGECLIDNITAPHENEIVASGGGEGGGQRRQHHLKNSNNIPTINSSKDLVVPEPHFQTPEAPGPKVKKLVKRSSTIRSDRSMHKAERTAENMMPNKQFSEYSSKELHNWLLHVVRLPRPFLDELHTRNRLEGVCLDQISETKLSKLIGTSDKLIRKKIFLALEETRSNYTRESTPSISNSDLVNKDHLWVAKVWLKRHLGLSHLSHAFLSRCIDGRLLRFIAGCPHARQKELLQLAANSYDPSPFGGGLSSSSITGVGGALNNRSISEPSKTDIRSIKYGLELLAKFDFQLDELDRRRSACESSNLDVLVWTNDRVAKWFAKMNLKNYTRGIEYSGIHGGMMVLDLQFSMATMAKLLQIPAEVVRKNNLDDKFSSLLKPSRFNEGVKNRRSTSIFRRRSYSQPRHSNASIGGNRKELTSPSYKSSAANTDQSDSASINNGVLPAHTTNAPPAHSAKLNHKEKSQTLDMSNSANQNFVRKYRKPTTRVPNSNTCQSSTLTDSTNDAHPSHHNPLAQQQHRVPDNTNLKVPASHFAKSPKSVTRSAQISRKLKSQSSGSDEEDSENSEEL